MVTFGNLIIGVGSINTENLGKKPSVSDHRFLYKYVLKLTYEHVEHEKKFPGGPGAIPGKGKGRGREEEGEKGLRREGEGKEIRKRGGEEGGEGEREGGTREGEGRKEGKDVPPKTKSCVRHWATMLKAKT